MLTKIQKKKFLKILNNFEPTKSNMMYDEVIDELIKQVKDEKTNKKD